MALTVIFALVGSMVLSMTLMPVLASPLLPKRIKEREPLMMRLAHSEFTPPFCNSPANQQGPRGCICMSVLFIAFGLIAPNLGAEFVHAFPKRAHRRQRCLPHRHRSG